jgi:hypothetical protein
MQVSFGSRKTQTIAMASVLLVLYSFGPIVAHADDSQQTVDCAATPDACQPQQDSETPPVVAQDNQTQTTTLDMNNQTYYGQVCDAGQSPDLCTPPQDNAQNAVVDQNNQTPPVQVDQTPPVQDNQNPPVQVDQNLPVQVDQNAPVQVDQNAPVQVDQNGNVVNDDAVSYYG